MKKLSIILAILSFSLCLYAQSFEDIPYNKTYTECKVYYDKLYNDGVESIQTDTTLEYANVSFDGFQYDSLSCFISRDSFRFTGFTLLKRFPISDTESAEQFYKAVATNTQQKCILSQVDSMTATLSFIDSTYTSIVVLSRQDSTDFIRVNLVCVSFDMMMGIVQNVANTFEEEKIEEEYNTLTRCLKVIGGVRFGMPYLQCKGILEKQYGIGSILEESDTAITLLYEKITIEGTPQRLVYFNFKNYGKHGLCLKDIFFANSLDIEHKDLITNAYHYLIANYKNDYLCAGESKTETSSTFRFIDTDNHILNIVTLSESNSDSDHQISQSIVFIPTSSQNEEYLLELAAKKKVQDEESQKISNVQFGWSYEQCKSVLDRKYNNGEYSTQSKPYHQLEYYEVYFGGIAYDFAHFGFESNGIDSYLTSIDFYSSWNIYESTSAKNKLARIIELYKRKYRLLNKTHNDSGYDTYTFNELGSPYFINIELKRAESKGGATRLYLMVSYFITKEHINPLDEI